MSKIPYICEKLQKKVIRANKEGKVGYFKSWSRSSHITPEMIGHVIMIHKGNSFSKRLINADMVGYKLGMFAPTRKVGKHGKAGTS